MKYTLLFAVFFLPFTSFAAEKTEVIEYLAMVSRAFSIDTGVFIEVARCESNFNTKAVGDSGRAYGPMQFHKATFEAFAKEVNVPDLEYKNWKDQAWLAGWAFKNGKKSHWTCHGKVVSA